MVANPGSFLFFMGAKFWTGLNSLQFLQGASCSEITTVYQWCRGSACTWGAMVVAVVRHPCCCCCCCHCSICSCVIAWPMQPCSLLIPVTLCVSFSQQQHLSQVVIPTTLAADNAGSFLLHGCRVPDCTPA